MDSISVVKNNQIYVGYNVDDLYDSNISCKNVNKLINCSYIDESNISSCSQKEICNNRDIKDELKELQQHHSSADGRYYDVSNLYQISIQNTFNLGIGIIGAITSIIIFS